MPWARNDVWGSTVPGPDGPNSLLGLLLHPDKPWPPLRLHHHHRCYAKPDRNGETDGKKGNPHGRGPAVLKCGIERAEGTLVPADEPGPRAERILHRTHGSTVTAVEPANGRNG